MYDSDHNSGFVEPSTPHATPRSRPANAWADSKVVVDEENLRRKLSGYKYCTINQDFQELCINCLTNLSSK